MQASSTHREDESVFRFLVRFLTDCGNDCTVLRCCLLGSLMSTVLEISYGAHSSQFYRLYKPLTPSVKRLLPVCVLIHGGFFKEKYHIDNSAIDALIPSLLESSMAVCLIEYRRVGGGGGFPSTNEDIISALSHIDSIASEHGLDKNRVVVVGHSAGGTLALWACCEPSVSALPNKPILCVSIAPIGDLVAGQLRRLSDEGDAIERYIGETLSSLTDCPPPAYLRASPQHLMPPKVFFPIGD